MRCINQHVKFSWNHKSCFSFVCKHEIVRNVVIDENVDQHSNCMSNGLGWIWLVKCFKIFLLLLVSIDLWFYDKSSNWPVWSNFELNSDLKHVDFVLIKMFQWRIKEINSCSFFNWETCYFTSFRSKDSVSVQQMKMKVVNPTFSSHWVISNSKILICGNPEDLKEKWHKLITQYLRKTFCSKQQQNTMINS